MVDNPIDSDSLIGSKRRTISETEQQEEALLQLQLPSETTADHRDSTPQHPQQETAISPNKKPKCFPLLPEENQEMGLHSFTQKNAKEDSFGVQQVDTEQRVVKVEAFESGNVLEAEKKRLLAELEVGNIFGRATNSSSKIDDEKKGSLKIEVIDDTALIGSFPLSRTGKDDKTKRSRRNGKNVKKGFGESGTGNKTGNTIMYSRKELEALRFAKVVEQRSFWKDVYNSLGKDVIRKYEKLGSWKHQKNTGSGSRSSSDTRHLFGRKGDSAACMGVIAGRGTRNGHNIFAH